MRIDVRDVIGLLNEESEFYDDERIPTAKRRRSLLSGIRATYHELNGRQLGPVDRDAIASR